MVSEDIVLNEFGLGRKVPLLMKSDFLKKLIPAPQSFLLIEERSLKPLDVLEKLVPRFTIHKCCIKSSHFIHYTSDFIHYIDSDISIHS